MAVKRCSKCDAYKTLSSFRKCKQAKGGYDWWCKNCRSDYEVERKGKAVRLKRKNHDVLESYDLADLIKEIGVGSK